MVENASPQTWKNLMCICFGLLTIFVTSIFVFEDYFTRETSQTIDKITLLKDIEYSNWGENSDETETKYLQRFNLKQVNVGGNCFGGVCPEVGERSVEMKVQYSYSNISFSQGNSGALKYLSNWERQLSNSQSLSDSIPTINYGADKIYNYDFYAPPSKRFVLLYNILTDSVRSILPAFYANYLFKYYFQSQKLVRSIFARATLNAEQSELLYNDGVYGWNNAQTLERWVSMCFGSQSRSASEQIRMQFQLSQSQIQKLIGKTSVMYKLGVALNGTIKYKVQRTDLRFENVCIPFCSDHALVAMQLTNSFLTSQSLFATTSLDQKTKDLNPSLYDDVEYATFCSLNENLTCIDNLNDIGFFYRNSLANFGLVSKVYLNLDKFDIIENILEIVDPQEGAPYGESVVSYMNYLTSQIFEAKGGAIDGSSFSLAFTNFNFLGPFLQQYQSFLHSELLSRAFYQRFIVSQSTACQTYFQGPFSFLATHCNNSQLNLQTLYSIRFYIQAYLDQRQDFINSLQINASQALQFLKLSDQSLFAKQMKTMQTDLANHYVCQHYTCTMQELGAREWGTSTILENLPEIYFSTKKARILDWDEDKIFGGTEPQFHKVTGTTLSFETSDKYLHSVFKIASYWNLIQYQLDPTNLISFYVQKVILDIVLEKPIQEKSIGELVNGYTSREIERKNKVPILKGGAPWLCPLTTAFKISSKGILPNTMNTGIFDKKKVRNLSELEGNTNSSSVYVIYQDKSQKVTELLTTHKNVRGSALLGFHPNIQAADELEVFLSFAYQSYLLERVEESSSDFEYETYTYKLKGSGEQVSVGVEEQNHNSIRIKPESYLVVEPITGLTLKFQITYQVYTELFYLQNYFFPPRPHNQYHIMDVTLNFQKINLQEIQQIVSNNSALKLLYIMTIICSGIVVVLFIVFGLSYCKSKKQRNHSQSMIEQLMEEELKKEHSKI